MSLFQRPGSPFWWMLLEGYGRKRESTGIKHHASSAHVRKLLREQAEAIYHARMVQLARGRVGLPNDSAVTFQQWSEWFDTHRIAKQRSAARARFILARLRKTFGPRLLREI